MKQILIYLPVIHAGYERFFDRHRDVGEVLVLGPGFRSVFRSIGKDIRALPPDRAAEYLRLALPGVAVKVIEPGDLPAAITAESLVLPDDDVMRELAEAHDLAAGRSVVFDPTFLRWDRQWSRAQRPAQFDGQVAADELSRTFLARAQELAGRSSDWWRQVGAIAVRGGEVLGASWNQHLPSAYSPYIDGDPRDGFSRGVRADLTTAIHAEASIVACAARAGISLAGADLYATTFPCPACARLIAEAGFSRCFFAGPYSVLRGEDVLRAAGIEVIWIDTSGR